MHFAPATELPGRSAKKNPRISRGRFWWI